MINYNPKNWFTLIFMFHKSTMMKHIVPNMLGVGLYTTGIIYLMLEVIKVDFDHSEYILNMQIHKLIGIVLGLVLVFRTNTAYSRWWEGRMLWGALVNHSRMLAIKTHGVLKADEMKERKFFAVGISNFARSMVTHLRKGTDRNELDHSVYKDPEALHKVKHVPNEVISQMEKEYVDLMNAGEINGEEYLVVNREMDGMIDALGGCERIRKTPIPFSYSMYIKKFIFVYVMTLPFGLLKEFHWWAIPAVMFIFYILVGIELIGEEIEDPFGTDVNDLDTDGLADTITDNVHEILRVERG